MVDRLVAVDDADYRLPEPVIGALMKGDVGLGDVDNTSDADKPISGPTQAALDGKSAVGHTHTSSDITDFVAAVNTAVSGGGSPVFAYLRAGCVDVTQDTRVVVLGSSTAVGGYTTNPEQGVFQRLAARAGSAQLNDLGAVSSPQAPAGMKWWTGALGGTTSANYADAAKRTKVAQVAPHYVFHMVGSNDWRTSVPPATYKANMLTVLDAIETATPGAVNVLVHQQGRRDYGPTYSWDAYGTALRELAEANPTRRTFIDMTGYFRPLGVETDNRGGIVTSDLIHMGDVGHRYMANIFSRLTGIPSSDDYAKTITMPFALPASASYSNNAIVHTVPIVAANYPRTVRLEGPSYITVATSGAANEMIAELQLTSDSSVLKRIRHRVPATLTGAHTVELNAILYLPPNVAASVALRVGAATTITVSGTAEYAEPRLVIEPV